MIWGDAAFLLSKSKYNENSIIAEVYTENYGKKSGIIFGASSRKTKNYLQIGNKIHVNYSSKDENSIGNFKVEIIKALTPLFFDNKKKLLCLTSAINLVKLLTAEAQKNSQIFNLIEHLYISMNREDWIKQYILWELKFLKLIGYDLELKNLVNKQIENNNVKYYVKSNNQIKFVPNFLVDDSQNIIDKENLLNGLKIVGDYLEKSILKPNNINFPNSRIDFINILK